MPHIRSVFPVAAACAIAISVAHAQAAPLEASPVPPAALDTLKKDFGMEEVIPLLSASATRTSSKKYLEARASNFKLIGTEKQGPLIVDAYSVLDMKSHIIGYRLFYAGENGPLAIADTVVNPAEKDATGAAAKLVAAALDSVSPPDGRKTYFLGIRNLDASRVVKIMVRTGAQSAEGPNYDIRYVVSKR
jgi:hypothetical protein